MSVKPFGVISDIHSGNKHFRPHSLKKVVRQMVEAKVSVILIPGDLLEGAFYTRGNQHNMTHVGIDAQTDNLLKHLPQNPGVSYWFITGNHENTFRKQIGVVPGEYIENRAKAAGRTDLKYFGYPHAKVTIGDFRVRMTHPANYNKYVQSAFHEKGIDMVVMGHYHKAKIEWYNRLPILLPGCMQEQTEWEAERGYQAKVGGFLVYPEKPNLMFQWIAG